MSRSSARESEAGRDGGGLEGGGENPSRGTGTAEIEGPREEGGPRAAPLDGDAAGDPESGRAASLNAGSDAIDAVFGGRRRRRTRQGGGGGGYDEQEEEDEEEDGEEGESEEAANGPDARKAYEDGLEEGRKQAFAEGHLFG